MNSGFVKRGYNSSVLTCDWYATNVEKSTFESLAISESPAYEAKGGSAGGRDYLLQIPVQTDDGRSV